MPDKDKFKFVTHDGFGKLRLEQSGNKYSVDGQEFIARKKTNNQWFETQDQIGYWEDFSKQKIVWGNLGLSAGFAEAPENMFVNAPCPMITPFNSYLLTVLNSQLGDWYIRQLGVTRNGGYFEYKPMFVEQLPVPVLPQANLSKFEADIANAANNDAINGLVFNLYHLTEEEKNYMLNA